VHRIGRTGRAGASGTAWSFCDRSERALLADVQKLIKKVVPVVKGHIFDGYGNGGGSDIPMTAPAHKPVKSARGGRRYRALAPR